MLRRNLPLTIPVRISLLEACSLETAFNIKNKIKKSEARNDSKFSCSVTSSLKQAILREKISVIYILQNAGFSSLPDQASCLIAWGSQCQKSALSLRSRIYLWLVAMGRPTAPKLNGGSPILDFQGFRQYVYSRLWLLCLLLTFSQMES